ncbi:MAG: hypothetical protein IJ491_09500 [Clostridia bacterium]|nr:hypothetical protein [Clostridia bacterium]
MDREAFKKFLNTRYFEFTTEEIEAIMQEEMDKSPEEMDLELIDLCLDALDGKFDHLKDEEKNSANVIDIHSSENQKFGRRTIVYIAAVVAMLATMTIFVCANHKDIDVPDGMVEFCQDYFTIDFGKFSAAQEEISKMTSTEPQQDDSSSVQTSESE